MTSVKDKIRVVRNLVNIMKLSATNFNTTDKTLLESDVYLQVAIKDWQDDYEKIKMLNREIIAQLNTDSQDSYELYVKDKVFENMQALYLQHCASLHEMLRDLNHAEKSNETFFDICNSTFNKGTNVTQDVHFAFHYPTITPFDGAYEKWGDFRDDFLVSVHENSSYNESIKFKLLRSSLKGDALKVVKREFGKLSVKDYNAIWKKLLDRYNHKRSLVYSHFQTLFYQPVVEKESADSIRGIYDTTFDALTSLKGLGLKTNDWGDILVFLVHSKLPAHTKELWDEKLGKSDELPEFDKFLEFLEVRFRTLERIESTKTMFNTFDGKKSSVKKLSTLQTSREETSTKKFTDKKKNFDCKCCHKGIHGLRKCKRFLAMSVPDRKSLVSSLKYCISCLSFSHQVAECQSAGRCNKCNSQHNSLLCAGSPSSIQQSTSALAPIMPDSTADGRFLQPNYPEASNTFQAFTTKSDDFSNALFPTALVKAINRNGKTIILRTLIDQCSDASYISQNAVKKLQLSLQEVNVQTSGLGNVATAESKAITSLQIASIYDNFSLDINAFVLSSVSQDRPSSRLSQLPNVSDLNLADPLYYLPGKIDLLLGCGVDSEIKLPGFHRLSAENIVLTNSQLGWIISGSVCFEKKSEVQTSLVTEKSLSDLNKSLVKFWEIEEMPNRVLTKEEHLAEIIYQKTTIRLPDGKYVVSLPFKDKISSFENMQKIAFTRFHYLEKKLSKNDSLRLQYHECLEEYIKLNHMTEVDSSAFPGGYFIPHHCVFKETSSTTKLRVVFDASAKDTSLKSLNENLCNGPRLQLDLLDLMLQFRLFRFAFTADIKQMYRQIWINPNDRKFQLILWRNKLNEITTYTLNTVTFGTTAAPYLAVKTLHRLAEDEMSNFPIGSKCLKNGFYVDDFIYGADSLEDSLLIQSETINILKSGGLHLRKWSSNCQQILDNVPLDDRETKTLLSFDEKSCVKTLGIQWSTVEDIFCYNISMDDQSFYSKRTVLSDIARIFDPLGWVSPVIIKAKILIQEMWVNQLDWDTPLPSDLAMEWDLLKKSLVQLNSLRIPRWLGTVSSSIVQLHGFSDASLKAYAAVIYLKTTVDNEIVVNLLIAKSKVAPFRKCTLPRLELCAAALLARMMDHIKSVLKFSSCECFYWSDSTITLSWIKDSPLKRKMFVANKVTEIQKASNHEQWRHVESKLNPADLATRGTFPLDLKDSILWWRGPDFVHSSTPKYVYQPDDNIQLPVEENAKAIKKNVQFLQTILTSRKANLKEVCSNVMWFQDECLNKFSTLSKLVRIIAYCLRFLKVKVASSLLIDPVEYDYALTTLLKIVQNEAFANEISDLKTEGVVNRQSSIFGLNPFLNALDGLIRLNTRLQNAEFLTYDQRYPVVLPYGHILSKLLIRHAHNAVLHGTVQQTLMFITQKYHIIRCKRLIASVIHNCVKCFRFRCGVQNQQMASLPKFRVSPANPFCNAGVDFAGPIEMKKFKGKCNSFLKGYIAVFVCFSTKAIHLEAVEDLSAEAFVACFRRFSGRRGYIENLHSDCGTNFIGAEKILSQLHDNQKADWINYVTQELNKNQTRWHFNPPGSPHFGGLWEAGVKSVKYHLKRVVGEHRLAYQDFETILIQIEACLNSRPLCKIENNKDQVILTPGHFLVGGPLVAVPQPKFYDKNISLLDRWNFLQKIVKDFWELWSFDYLNSLRQRTKWKHATKNINVDDVVILREKNLPPTLWKLARVAQIHPGEDGLVRVVTLQLNNKYFKRPIIKLCPLPIQN